MAASTFDAYFPELLKHEGGYVDHPRDPGGATNLGITIQTLKDWRETPVTKADVKALTKAEAAEIYRENYWNAIGGDNLPAGVDAVALDIAVNHGVGRWKQWKPIIAGLSPSDAVKALCERRRRFYRGLPTFPTFGKGWMRRANEVEAWALRYIAKTNGPAEPSPKPPKPVEEPEAKPSGEPPFVKSKTLWATIIDKLQLAVAPVLGALAGIDWKTVLALSVLISVAFGLFVIRERWLKHVRFGI